MILMAKPYSYNAHFEFDGDRFDVNIVDFSYSWALVNKGASQARQAYTIYPNRVEQSPISITLVFRNPDEYRRFGEWCMEYQRKATSTANPPVMTLTSKAVGEGVRYGVVIGSVPMSFDYRMSAPKMRLSLMIIRDETDTGLVSDSGMTGDANDLPGDDLVDASDVKDSGDGAYSDGKYGLEGGIRDPFSEKA